MSKIVKYNSKLVNKVIMMKSEESEHAVYVGIFLKTGNCKHPRKWFQESRPYKCNQTLTMCGVCNKVMFRVYDQ